MHMELLSPKSPMKLSDKQPPQVCAVLPHGDLRSAEQFSACEQLTVFRSDITSPVDCLIASTLCPGVPLTIEKSCEYDTVSDFRTVTAP